MTIVTNASACRYRVWRGGRRPSLPSRLFSNEARPLFSAERGCQSRGNPPDQPRHHTCPLRSLSTQSSSFVHGLRDSLRRFYCPRGRRHRVGLDNSKAVSHLGTWVQYFLDARSCLYLVLVDHLQLRSCETRMTVLTKKPLGYLSCGSRSSALLSLVDQQPAATAVFFFSVRLMVIPGRCSLAGDS